MTICPGFVLGPNLNGASFASGDVVRDIMTKKIPGFPLAQFAMVDVRDVALAHLNAVKVPEARNKRFLLVNRGEDFSKIGDWLAEKYRPDYPVTTGILPKCLLQCMACFRDDAKNMIAVWGKKMTFDNSETTSILKVQFTDLKQSVQEMGDTLIATGYVPDKKKKK